MQELLVSKFIKPFVIIIICSMTIKAFAESRDDLLTSCYQFSTAEGPESQSALIERKEIWCYQKLNYPAGALFIFNADQNQVIPELSFVVDATGLITHTSMSQGFRTVHKVFAKDYNPFSIPVTEPVGMMPIVRPFFSEQMQNSYDEALNLLSGTAIPLHGMSLETGTFTEDAEAKPWRGYWWPYNGQRLSAATNSPMAKYDRFVKARTGKNPGARSWENARHRYHDVDWEGHCNGWAASSVLRAEPQRSKIDRQSGVIFSVIDQKGLLAETDYCVKYAFFGSRYRGARSNPYDISAVSFHKTLVYYIGQLKKLVAVDYKPLEAVDNHVISGYTMKIQKINSTTYSVVTKVRIHKYDKARTNKPGDAPMYTRTYSYRLKVDAEGNIQSGAWRSGNPDFLWVPLASVDCNKNNPRINHDFIQEILDLPTTN